MDSSLLLVILVISIFLNGFLAFRVLKKNDKSSPTNSGATAATSSSSSSKSSLAKKAKSGAAVSSPKNQPSRAPTKSIPTPSNSETASSSSSSPSSTETPTTAASGPRREVTCTEAVAWLESQTQLAGSVITSVPDVSEMSEASVRPVDKWQPWFINACRLIMEKTPPDAVAIFYQTDIKPLGIWIDKGYMVAQAAQQAGMTQLWHKIVVAERVDSMRGGVATFAHLLCYSKVSAETSITSLVYRSSDMIDTINIERACSTTLSVT
jgi:hypothetical protein